MTDKQNQAYQDYLNGMKYTEIAAKYEVSVSAVKMWAKREWKSKNDSEVAIKKVTRSQSHKKGGQKSNTNTVKHGAYKKVSWEVLEDDDEAELIAQIDYSPEEILKSNYKNLLLRERRLLKLIKQYKEESARNKNLILGSVTKIHTRGGDDEEDKTITTAEGVFNALKVYETEITKIQAQKIKTAIELKKAIEEEKDAEHEELFNDNTLSLAQILRQPIAPHEINIKKEGDED